METDLDADREQLLRFRDARKIGTRLMFDGHILCKPAHKRVSVWVLGDLTNTNIVMR